MYNNVHVATILDDYKMVRYPVLNSNISLSSDPSFKIKLFWGTPMQHSESHVINHTINRYTGISLPHIEHTGILLVKICPYLKLSDVTLSLMRRKYLFIKPWTNLILNLQLCISSGQSWLSNGKYFRFIVHPSLALILIKIRRVNMPNMTNQPIQGIFFTGRRFYYQNYWYNNF